MKCLLMKLHNREQIIHVVLGLFCSFFCSFIIDIIVTDFFAINNYICQVQISSQSRSVMVTLKTGFNYIT